MKLTTQKIQAAMWEANFNIEKLHKKLLDYYGIYLHEDETHKIVTHTGAEGIIAAHIANELGLPTPAKYVPLKKSLEEFKEITHTVPQSGFAGVWWCNGGWRAAVTIAGDRHDLGYFDDPIDGSRAIRELKKTKAVKKASSKYIGVTWSKGGQKWMASIGISKVNIYLGLFEEEAAAASAYNDAARPLGRPLNEVV